MQELFEQALERPEADRERWLASRIGPVMRERGMLFVGLDVIGGLVTEINVTSPTGIREIEAQCGDDIAGGLIEAWNVSFERHIWERVCVPRMGWPPVPRWQWRCAMAKARAFALPGGLAKAADVLGSGTLKLKAELPGVKREEVKVTVEDGVLMLSGERRFEKEEKDKKFHKVERVYGKFVRRMALPSDVDEGKVSAEFKDGVLNVHLPKSAQAKPHSVDVKIM